MEDSQVEIIVGSITVLRTEMNKKFDTVYKKFDDLHCTEHVERLARTEQWVEGHKNGEVKEQGKEQITLRRIALMLSGFAILITIAFFVIGRFM